MEWGQSKKAESENQVVLSPASLVYARQDKAVCIRKVESCSWRTKSGLGGSFAVGCCGMYCLCLVLWLRPRVCTLLSCALLCFALLSLAVKIPIKTWTRGEGWIVDR